jgi:ion channel-forming bestrophin family protein
MAIYLFAVTLSVSLRDIDIQFELPLMLILSLVFLLLEKSAFDLQDPFRNRPSDTAVTAISREIEINIRHMLGETDAPESVKPNEFYIL